MGLSLRRWKPGQLLLGWVAYWAGLVAVTLTPAIKATMRATQVAKDHGQINAGFNNSMLNYTVLENGVTTYAGTVSVTTLLLWVAGPPLLLWLAWLLMRDRPTPHAQFSDGALQTPALSEGSAPAEPWQPREMNRERADGGRVRTPQA
jgi:hypothetical protein